MTYILEKVPARELESRLHRMASTGERLVSFCYLPTAQYALVIDPPGHARLVLPEYREEPAPQSMQVGPGTFIDHSREDEPVPATERPESFRSLVDQDAVADALTEPLDEVKTDEQPDPSSEPPLGEADPEQHPELFPASEPEDEEPPLSE